MKSKFILFIVLVSSSLIFSQQKITTLNDKENVAVTADEVPENGKIENGVYTCYRFDWKITIPESYFVTDVKAIEEVEKKAFEANKKSLPEGTVLTYNRSHLIGFSLDKRNTFSSTFEPLDKSKTTTFEEHKNFMIKLLTDTYSKIQTLKCEVSSSNMKIGKYAFYKIQTRLYDAKTNELLLTQDLYNSFINGNLFSVNINYNNPNIGMLLTSNLISSLNN